MAEPRQPTEVENSEVQQLPTPQPKSEQRVQDILREIEEERQWSENLEAKRLRLKAEEEDSESARGVISDEDHMDSGP